MGRSIAFLKIKKASDGEQWAVFGSDEHQKLKPFRLFFVLLFSVFIRSLFYL